MNKEVQEPNLDQVLVDAVELAGDVNIYSPMVGRTFFKRLYNMLLGLAEPGILVVDFSRVGVVDSSALMISIGILLAICQRNRWRKTIVCLNTTGPIRITLKQAIVAQQYADNPLADAPQIYLLLCASDSRTKNWFLLGDLSERQVALWDALLKTQFVSVKDLADRLNVSVADIDSDVQIFHANTILFHGEAYSGVVWPLPILITQNLGGELWM
jgi:hypothetical protein